MTDSLAFVLVLIFPLLGISMGLLRIPVTVQLWGTVLVCGLELLGAFGMLLIVFAKERVFFAGDILFADMLSAYNLVLVSFVFFMSSLYAVTYYGKGADSAHFDLKHAGRYTTLWNLFLFTMILVLVSNNMGVLWVALEATTLASAFLILTRGVSASVEAMWKYLLICSVGIAFGLIGILLLSAASGQVPGLESTLLWTELLNVASDFDGRVMLVAFVFILIGFGTKAGLAPMHTWLPDAHSQAPTPVSAVFSAVMLTCALYCVFRFLPLTERALGEAGQARALLLFFGMLSVGISMIFIPAQRDIKRFLAYSSIEHIGLVTAGVGLGGIGIIAGLLHTTNHSIAKMLAFFSAGKIAHTYDTRDMTEIRGALRTTKLWGIGFFISTLALLGVAPLAIFTSELQIFAAGFSMKRFGVLALLLLGTTTIFIGGTRHVFNVSLGKEEKTIPVKRSGTVDKVIIGCLSLWLLTIGVWIPGFFREVLQRAAGIIGR